MCTYLKAGCRLRRKTSASLAADVTMAACSALCECVAPVLELRLPSDRPSSSLITVCVLVVCRRGEMKMNIHAWNKLD